MIRSLFQVIVYFILIFGAISCAKTVPTVSIAPEKKTSGAVARPAKAITKPRPVPKKTTTVSKPAKKTPTPAKVLTSFQSMGNDMANIKIQLKDNKTFDFVMTIPAKTPEEKEERITMLGTWKEDKDRTVLSFARKDIDLKSLFDKSFVTADEFEILTPQAVSINNLATIIHIWGIPCEKK